MLRKTKKIWFDGKLVDWDKAKVHVLSHGLHYGSGVFEGIRAYETKKGVAVFRLDDHLERFFYSAKVLGMKIPFSKKEIKNAILKLIKVNQIKDCYIRPIAFFGYGKMGLSPKNAKVNLAIALWEWKSYLGEKPVKVKISSYRRIDPKTTEIKAKICGHYVNSILATLEAQKAGFDEALLLDLQGFVSEGAAENIFMVKKGKLFTPLPKTILPGITRKTVFQIAKDLKIKVIEKNIRPSELKKADEAFFCGTAAEITPIGQIEEVKINQGKIGPLTSKIKDFYQRIVRAKEEKYLKWLTFC